MPYNAQATWMYSTSVWGGWAAAGVNWTSPTLVTATSSGSVWGGWVSSAGTTSSASLVDWWGVPVSARAAPVSVRAADPAELARRAVAARIRDEEHDARRRKEDAARLEADRKAEVLLLRHLSDAQRAEYVATGAFMVVLGSGARYRIKKGWAGNVQRAEPLQMQDNADGRIELSANDFNPVEQFCIHPVDSVPFCDNMLAQKLLLEADETNFRRIANVTQLRRTGG